MDYPDQHHGKPLLHPDLFRLTALELRPYCLARHWYVLQKMVIFTAVLLKLKAMVEQRIRVVMLITIGERHGQRICSPPVALLMCISSMECIIV